MVFVTVRTVDRKYTKIVFLVAIDVATIYSLVFDKSEILRLCCITSQYLQSLNISNIKES